MSISQYLLCLIYYAGYLYHFFQKIRNLKNF